MESWLCKVGSLVCNHASERTIHIGSNFLPLCARCTGIYSGVLIGTVYQFFLRQWRIRELPPLKISMLALLFLGILIVDSIGSNFNYWTFSNQARFNLGLLGGSSISLFLFPVFNYSLFAGSKRDTGITAWRGYAGLMFLLLLTSFAIVSNNSVFYSPFALISVTGMILLFLLLNIVIAAQITGFKRTRNKLKVIPFTGIILILTACELYIFRKF